MKSIFSLALALACQQQAFGQDDAEHRILLDRFAQPLYLSYRAQVELDLGQQTVRRALHVQNGQLLSANPAQMQLHRRAEAITALLNNYQALWDDKNAEQIAQRVTTKVRFEPKDGWRYTRVFWLDQDTGLPLKTETYRKNELVERMQVTTIEFDPASDKPTTQLMPTPVFVVRNAPSGFELVNVVVSERRAQQIYSDGLAHVSIFVQSTGSLPASSGNSQRGSTNFVLRRSGDVDLVAVGEVPQATLDRFVSGVDVLDR